MQIGDLVTIKPHVQPPQHYGVGLVVDQYVTDVESWGKEIEKIKVRWAKLPNETPMFMCSENVELVSGVIR